MCSESSTLSHRKSTIQSQFLSSFSAVTKKIDILISNGIRGPSNRGSDVSVDLEAIKNTERNILQQLADMRYILLPEMNHSSRHQYSIPTP